MGGGTPLRRTQFCRFTKSLAPSHSSVGLHPAQLLPIGNIHLPNKMKPNRLGTPSSNTRRLVHRSDQAPQPESSWHRCWHCAAPATPATKLGPAPKGRAKVLVIRRLDVQAPRCFFACFHSFLSGCQPMGLVSLEFMNTTYYKVG